jgi:hypothetical protein
MGRLEELEAENQRLRDDRRIGEAAFRNEVLDGISGIKIMCAGCQAKASNLAKSVTELERTVYGVQDEPGIKGHVAELRKESGMVRWLLLAIVGALILSIVDRFVKGG